MKSLKWKYLSKTVSFKGDEELLGLKSGCKFWWFTMLDLSTFPAIFWHSKEDSEEKGKYKRWVESCNIRDGNKHKWPSRISPKITCCSAKYSRTHSELCLNWVWEHKNPQPQMALCGENVNYSTILILHKSAHISFVWLDSDVK